MDQYWEYVLVGSQRLVQTADNVGDSKSFQRLFGKGSADGAQEQVGTDFGWLEVRLEVFHHEDDFDPLHELLDVVFVQRLFLHWEDTWFHEGDVHETRLDFWRENGVNWLFGSFHFKKESQV